MVGAFYGDDWSEEFLGSQVVKGEFGITAPNIANLARAVGYHAEVVSATFFELKALLQNSNPVIAYLQTSGLPDLPTHRYHAVVVTRATSEEVEMIDPATGTLKRVPATDFLRAWAATENTAIVCRPG